MSALINRTLPHIKMSAVHFGRCVLFAAVSAKLDAAIAANLKELGYEG
jgi:hypothetical protein